MKLLSLLAASASVAQAALKWQNVRFGGGGGFVPGIEFHPTTKGVAYARTDIGGLYRLNADDSWTPLTDNTGVDATWSRWGIDALALDPSNPNKVLTAAGLYTNSWDPNKGAIGISNDKGATWSFTELPFKVGGNMPGRGMGERLAVDPKNSNIIYFGARSGNGLWKSTDGGKSFSKVTSFTNVGTYVADPSDSSGYNSDIQGLSFVTFDSTSSLVNGATSRIFVGVADTKTASVYVTTDAGKTWKPVDGQPVKYLPHKGQFSPKEKALYLSYSNGGGPYDGTAGAVYRYDVAANTWKDITPPGDIYFGFGGLALDRQKSGTLVVASLNSWYPDAQFFRSTDSGKTWSTLWNYNAQGNLDLHYSISTPKAPWIYKNFISVDTKKLGWMVEALAIDPFDSDHWLYGTGLTLYGGHDLTKWDTVHNITIESLADGIEETAVLDVKSAPGGSELLAAVGDDSGFTFASKSVLGKSPLSAWDNPMFTSSTSADYAGKKVGNVVRAGNSDSNPQVALSSDGGKSWKVHGAAEQGPKGGSISYSANGDTILWSPENRGVLRSQNEGSFASVSSLPSGALVASDKQDNDYFYSASGSKFYVSNNTASSFSTGGSLDGANSVKDIAAHPTKAGEVWVSTDAGIFRSTDYGSAFSKIGGLSKTEQIALGKGSGSNWNVYAFGTGSAGRKLYGSSDLGKTWTDLQGSMGFGAADSAKLAGSGNEAGLVYVGTNGRGVFWGLGTI
ncbi:xyloglucanase [Fusarium oxysporum f. sp. melonis 26406]|uniref:Xyloglucanase n=1 Tax=Fusarium oxysporum f. sp. melonis 26406 TaxID=1089452 RepID=X0A6T8_FUSOX|nr:xyloglucanase [Fusarium oxysporum f. sp. melonis 26406]